MNGLSNPPGTRRAPALLARGLVLSAVLVLAACGTTPLVPNGAGMQPITVPEENYALFEVEITEPGLYALQVVDLDPAASQRRVARASNLARIAGGLEGGLNGGLAKTTRASIGTDSFDAFAGVIWSVYGRKSANPPAANPAGAPAGSPPRSPAAPVSGATALAQATAPATAASGGSTPAATDLGPRLMQSTERPLSETGKRAPERARLEPGRYVIRVATGYGTVRTQADRVEVGLVRLADGTSIPAGDRVTAVPVQRAGSPATASPAPATPPAPQR
jgi:RNA polymerase subunit RPABC4/transcription elongation factor Spt4